VDVGYYHRSVLDSSNVGSFNRNYGRASAAFTITDFVFTNLSFMVAGDSWSSDSNDSSSLSGDLTYAFKRSGRASIGTYYSLYKYDNTYQLEEHDRVRTYYVSAKLPLMNQFSVNGSYELEKGLDTYHVMKAGIRYDF